METRKQKIIFNSNFNLNIENFFDYNAFEEIFKIDKISG